MSDADAIPETSDPTTAEAAPAPRDLASRFGVAALGGAGALGILGDLLLREVPWGLNLLIWLAALVAVCQRLARVTGVRVATGSWVPALLGAATLMTWRDSPTLKGLDLIAIGVILALAAWSARRGVVRRAGVAELAAALGYAALDAWSGALRLVFHDVRWGEIPRGAGTRHAGALLRGLGLGLPVAGVFAALLAAADPRFEAFLDSLVDWDPAALAGHLLLAGAFAFVAAGVLRALALENGEAPTPRVPVPGPFLGVVEVVTVMSLLNALFLAFVALQLPYLFGTADVVTEGAFTYADYAKRGFFELVTVAGLVIPVLLALDWFRRAERPSQVYLFRGMAWMQVMLVGVIVASGLHRMGLYQRAYGLTELRFYTTAFMGWIAIVLAWFCASVLQGRREHFAFGAMISAGVMAVGLHAANPDAWIVRSNLSLADRGRPFDARYAASLSADAVPTLIAGMRRLPESERCAVGERLERRWSAAGDWRTWSWGRSRARNRVGRALREGCPPLVPNTITHRS